MWKVTVPSEDGFSETIFADGLDYETACAYAQEWSAKHGAPAYVEKE
jgi:hypothetical protein